MTERLRVVQVIPTLKQGGLEHVAANLSVALVPHVERIVVCSSGGDPYSQVVRAAGIPIEHMPRPWPRPVPLGRAALAIARVLRRERPHVVHAHNPAASAAAALARRLARAPEIAIVSTYHGVAPSRLGRANRALALSADVVVGVGPSTTRALVEAGFPPDRTRTIFNAVDAQPTRTAAAVRDEFAADGVPLIVSVGRYFTEKNQELLLAALARLDRPFKALLVGQGPLEDRLRARVAELGLDGRCLVTGDRDDAVDIIAAADVFVLSSLTEGLPLVLLEAMSVGTPVVSTAVGGVGDIVTDGRTGLLVPSGDEAALVAAVERVLDDGELAARLASDAGELVRGRTSLEAMVEDYRRLYADAASARQAR